MNRNRHWIKFGLLLGVLAASPGCVSEMIATAMTDPPNGGRQEVDPDRVGPNLYDAQEQLDVPGPPPVTLAYWVMEPGPARILRIAEGDGDASEPAPAGWRSLDANAYGSRGFYRTQRGPIDPDATARATVIILQGWGTRVSTGDYLLHLSAALANAGCRVIAPDLRGHGDSTGEFVTSGFREVEDLSHLLDHFANMGKLEGPVGVVGHSYGGGIAIQFAAHDPRVKRVLALSPLVDVRINMLDGVRGFAKMQRPIFWTLYLQWAINQSMIDVAQEKMEERGGADLDVHNALYQVKELDVPLLVLQGGEDPVTPPADAALLREANPRHVELVVYPEADHTSYLRNHFDDVRSRLDRWCERLIASE